MTAEQARELTVEAITSKEMEVGIRLEWILEQVKESARNAKRNVTIDDACKGFNNDQWQALRKSLESLGYKVAWTDNHHGSYVNVSW